MWEAASHTTTAAAAAAHVSRALVCELAEGSCTRAACDALLCGNDTVPGIRLSARHDEWRLSGSRVHVSRARSGWDALGGLAGVRRPV